MSLESALNGLKLIKGLVGGGSGSTGPRDTQLDINKFKSETSKLDGFAKPNLFMLRITPTTGFWAGADMGGNYGSLVYFCESVNMPGINIIPADIANQGYGILDRRPVGAVVPEVAATFLIDGKGQNLKFFQDWMNNVVKFSKPEGNDTGIEEGNPGAKTEVNFSEVRYRGNYLCTIEIFMYSPTGQGDGGGQIVKWTGKECWPFTMGDVALAWGQNDDLARVTVAFQVRSWHTENMDATGESSLREEGFLDKLLRIGQAANTLKSAIKKPQHVGDIINVVNTTTNVLNSFGGGKG